MTTVKDRAARRCKPKTTACPECGGLECLCRPRFFAGQLLSEADLNRLDRYLMAKNRLHNRHLHGWGVVCGLEVACHPCDNAVTVSPGYALSPCGDDIVVCKADTVDICALIQRCRAKERSAVECRPYGATKGCEGAEEDWVLAIHYEERPSRGVTALRDTGGGCGGSPGCTCGCGGTTGAAHGGCTCGGNGNGTSTAARTARRGRPAECEPTVTCEGYRYEVYRAPEREDKSPTDPRNGLFRFSDIVCGMEGELFERICCCWRDLEEAIATAPGSNSEDPLADWTAWLCRVKRSLQDYLLRHAPHNCELMARLNAISFQQTGDFDRTSNPLAELFLVYVELLVACVCSALLPPCPEPAADARVPLAVVRVTTSGCKLKHVCNWTPLRRFVLTFENLYYWLSWLPFWSAIRERLHEMCCNAFSLRMQYFGVAPATAAGAEGAAASDSQHFTFVRSKRDPATPDFTATLLQKLQREPKGLSFGDAFQAAFVRDAKGFSLTEAPVQSLKFRLFNEIAATALWGLSPTFLSAVAGPESVTIGREEVDSLRVAMDQLTKTVDAQKVEIADLRTRIGPQ